MSLPLRRLVATSLGLGLAVAAGVTPTAAANPDNTWTALARLPENTGAPIFALAVSPAEPQTLLTGTEAGTIFRSADGGATWREVRRDPGHPVLAISFNPYKPGQVLAGTRGAGVLRSTDGGLTWASQAGTERAAVRGFGFARSLVAAGTDQGVLLGREAGAWSPAGLSQISVAAVAFPAQVDPVRIVAGGDTTRSAEALPLFGSPDGGASWSAIKPPSTAASMVTALAAGQAPPKSDVRPLLMGTNAALYVSSDGGQSWAQLTGNGVLPATDFTAATFVTTHSDRYYVASDGGASDRGGVWSTTDSGQHFTSLQAPLPGVTALAVTSEEQPTLYVAAFRPGDHTALLFSYRDTGGAPQQPAALPPSPGHSATARPAAPAARNWLIVLATGPEAPFLVLGAGTGLVLLLTVVAHVTRARRRRL